MSLFSRRILYLSFILLFFFIVPALILYAAGYKFDFNKKRLERTGILSIKTEPAGAKIYLDGKPQGASLWEETIASIKPLYSFIYPGAGDNNQYTLTPAKISGLLPEDYDLEINLPNYWPWQKKISIEGGGSTNLDVALFKKDLPLSVFDGEIIWTAFSPDKKYLATLANDGLKIINLPDGTNVAIAKEEYYATSTLIWSPGSDKMLWGDNIYSINDLKNPFNLAKGEKDKISKTSWRDNSNLFFSNKNSVNVFNVSTREKKVVLDKISPLDFTFKDKNLLVIAQENKNVKLKIFDAGNNYSLTKEIDLPFSLNYHFINPAANLVNLYDQENKNLYLLDLFSDNPIVDKIENAEGSDWMIKNNFLSVSEEKLLYVSGFEIWNFDLKAGTKDLLTRLSEPIKGVLWYADSSHVIYYTNDAINMIGLENKDRLDIINLVKMEKIDAVYLSSDGNILYFSGEINGKQGIYKLQIK